MFWASLTCLTLAASAIASPYKRAEGLSVNVVPAAASIDSLDGLKFTASITNNRAEAVKILKYATILDGRLPTRSFEVSKGGNPVNFTGIKISVDLKIAGESAYTTINAVGGLYDFSSSGVGKYSFQPITNFFFANDDAQAENVKRFVEAEVISSPVEVEITGGLDSREVDSLDSRAVPTCTSKSQKTFIASGLVEGQKLAQIAATSLSGGETGSSDSASIFASYFGAKAASKVEHVLDAVAEERNTTRTLNCEDEFEGCEDGVIAYTLIATLNIYFCPIFFSELPLESICMGEVAARNFRGGTVLHELTHALSGTIDVRYGCARDAQLSPSSALKNADSYNCFATEVYQATQCGDLGGSTPGGNNTSGWP